MKPDSATLAAELLDTRKDRDAWRESSYSRACLLERAHEETIALRAELGRMRAALAAACPETFRDEEPR